MLFGLDAPVVIGPMNGGMSYPKAFRDPEGVASSLLLSIGRGFSGLANQLIPGKRRAACLLVANNRTAEALPKGTGPVVTLVENGVDLSLWQPDRRVDATTESTVVRFFFMGRLVGWKAVDILIEAFLTARTRAPMSLQIIGDGPEMALLQAQARAVGCIASSPDLDGMIYFAGWKSQLEASRIASQQDCLVLSSIFECGGAVVLEAMSLGLPVIATRWGGPADYVDETCGILVSPDSRQTMINGFESAMVRLANDSKLRMRMGESGAAKVRREYDWEEKVNKIIQVFEGIISKRRDG